MTEQTPEHQVSAPHFTFGDLAMIVLAGLLTALVASLIVELTAGPDDVVWSIVFVLPAQYVGQVAVLRWVVQRRQTTFLEGLRFDIEPGDLFYTLAGLSLQFALALLFFPLYEILGVEDSGQTIVDVAADTDLPLMAIIVLSLTAAVAAPVVEELTFRGVLLQTLARRVSVRATIVASSGIFAGLHILSVNLSDPQWFTQFLLLVPQLFLVALPLAWLTIKHNRLGPAIFTHAGFNLWLVIFVAGADYFNSLQWRVAGRVRLPGPPFGGRRPSHPRPGCGHQARHGSGCGPPLPGPTR